MSVLLKFLFVSCVIFSLFPSLSFATLEWSEEPVIPLIDEALDSAVAPDGSLLFVLTRSGNILVLDPSGKLKTSIDGPFNATSLTVSNDGKKLFLTTKGEKKLQVVSLLDRFNIPVGGSPVKGDIAAAVTVAVFSDFQWPYCARINPLLDQLVEKYPGKVKVVFKNIPLPNHNMARPAAQASLAAHAQGKFWAYHDKVFGSYNQLSEQKLLTFAQELQLDLAKFNLDRTSSLVQGQIDQDLQLGQAVGITGTPTIFINGVKLESGSPDVFQMINAELKRLSK